jgi:hypothetical protein
MSLAYTGQANELSDIVARDSFLDALDNHALRVRILDKDPKTLEDALSIACRLEAFEKIGEVQQPDKSNPDRNRNKSVRFAAINNQVGDNENDQGETNSQLKELKRALELCKNEVSQYRKEIQTLRTQSQQTEATKNVPTFQNLPNYWDVPINQSVLRGVSELNVGAQCYVPTSMTQGAHSPPQEAFQPFVTTQVMEPPVDAYSRQNQQAMTPNGRSGGMWNRGRRRSQYNSNTCRRCGLEGHWAAQCPTKTGPGSNTGQANTGNQPGSTNLVNPSAVKDAGNH